MNPKHAWGWLAVAAGLFAALMLRRHILPKPDPGPARLLPGLELAEIHSVEILPANQSPLRVERANGAWLLTEPVHFAARTGAISNLLQALWTTTPTTRLSAAEVGAERVAQDKFGFNPPSFTVILQPGDQHIQFGKKNGPGDQVFVKVVGREGVAVVDAGLLSWIPRSADDWRETRLVDFTRLEFDGLSVTNGAKALELTRDLTNGLWRLVQPMQARADGARIVENLVKLHALQSTQFLDRPPADFEALGLQPPELSLAFTRGTNTVLLLAFGKSPTNNPAQIYVRRDAENTAMVVSKDASEPWHATYETFRDRHLLSPTGPLAAIEFHATEDFEVRRTNQDWIVTPENFPADPELVTALLTNLAALKVAQFYADVVVAPDLPKLGLAEPVYRLILQAADSATTNRALAEIDFGTNQDGLIYVRRSDENSVYTVKLADVQWLPLTALQLRERAVWSFSTNDVVGVTVRKNGKVRELLRKGPARWALAPGSQGILDEVTMAAIEETTYRFGRLTAEVWTQRGDQNRERFGFRPEGLSLTFELRNGTKLDIDFGGEASLGSPYARVNLNGEPWIFEFPPLLYQLVQGFLTLPPEAH